MLFFCKVRENAIKEDVEMLIKTVKRTAIEGNTMHYPFAAQRLTKTLNQNKSNAVLEAKQVGFQ